MKYAYINIGFAIMAIVFATASTVSAQEISTRAAVEITPTTIGQIDTVPVNSEVITVTEAPVIDPAMSVPVISDAASWYAESQASIQSEREKLKAERRNLFLNIKTQIKKIIGAF